MTQFLTMLKDELSFKVENDNLHIRSEQIRTRLRFYPFMILSQVLVALLFAWLIQEHANGIVLLGWLSSFYILHGVDILLWWRYRDRIHTVQDCRQWRLFFDVITSLSGLMWGAMTLLFFPPDFALQIFIICLTLGLIAGAVTLNSTYPRSAYLYVFAIAIPMLATLVLAGGKVHWILAALYLLFVIGSLIASRELSKVFWESLRQRYENEQLIQQLTEQKTIAETANRNKSKFLAAASHDLRQPLQALVLFSEALQDSSKDAETLHLSGQINLSVRSLVDMFDKLLDISKFDAGIIQASMQHFRLQEVFDRLDAEFSPQAQSKGLKLVMPHTGLLGYSDPHLLERILRNLISNAIRYTDFGSVQADCTGMGDTVQISVIDTGIGIHADNIQHIFDEYYQVDNQHRDQQKGLGLGLAIVRRMETLLNCHIDVISKPGRGSRFSFNIPQGQAVQRAQVTAAPPIPKDLRGVSVALVDDNREIREMIAKLLTRWGCRVCDGESAHAVLAQLKQADAPPDIFICDYRLPHEQTAIDALRELHSLWNRDIPTLILTGDTAPETLQAIKASGAFLLHKPVSPARLRSLLYFALQTKKTSETPITPDL